LKKEVLLKYVSWIIKIWSSYYKNYKIRVSDNWLLSLLTIQVPALSGCKCFCSTSCKFDQQLKLKLSHYTPRRCLGEMRYSSYSFLTSALDGGELSASRPGRSLAPGKGPPVAIVQEIGWAPEPVWTQRLEEKSFRLYRDRNSIAR
jgi:hypothetical protein